MTKVTPISQRKSDHININLEKDVKSSLTTGLERFQFIHEALPELDLDKVDTSLSLFKKKLFAPILISSMTGGTKEAEKINMYLAEAAQETGVAMGVGSQRAALENNEQVTSFQVRKVAPDILLFANLGAVQLNYGYTVNECQMAVDMIEADALYLHLNPLQESIQLLGNTNFSGLAKKIEGVCRKLPVPVIVKEVGWGISKRTAKILSDVGVAAIDISGAGGTSWSQVESHRASDVLMRDLAATFVGWGIPTAESILMVKSVVPDMLVFASGGLCDGLDIAKCIALGATMGGMAGQFLKYGARSLDSTIKAIRLVQRQLQVSMFSAGINNLLALRREKLIELNH